MNNTFAGYLQRRRVSNAIESAVIGVIEPLEIFLIREGVSAEQVALVVAAAERELQPIVSDPAALFAGSLDGSKIATQIRTRNGAFPEEIAEERLEGIYELLLPRMATVLCEILPVVDAWRLDGWRVAFRRLDEIAILIHDVLGHLDHGAVSVSSTADGLLSRVRRGIAQRCALRMDVTALRSDNVIGCRFDAIFVHPRLRELEPESHRVLENEKGACGHFLSSGTRAVVVGAPGAGKSTWLRWLERIGNETGWSGVVVRAELRALVGAACLPSWVESLRRSSGVHLTAELATETVTRWRDDGQIAFLVDGFDEVASAQRESVRGWLQRLSDAVGPCPVILTSRPLTTDHLATLGEQWSAWRIEPFDNDTVVEYIQRWYQSAELPGGINREIDAESLARVWFADPTLAPLTGNPLLLATLLLVHVLDGSLPTGRARLYERYVDGMLGS